VLVIERLVFRSRAADEAAIAQADVINKSLGAEKDHLPGSIDDRAVLGYVRHVDDLWLTVRQVAHASRRGACAVRSRLARRSWFLGSSSNRDTFAHRRGRPRRPILDRKIAVLRLKLTQSL